MKQFNIDQLNSVFEQRLKKSRDEFFKNSESYNEFAAKTRAEETKCVEALGLLEEFAKNKILEANKEKESVSLLNSIQLTEEEMLIVENKAPVTEAFKARMTELKDNLSKVYQAVDQGELNFKLFTKEDLDKFFEFTEEELNILLTNGEEKKQV